MEFNFDFVLKPITPSERRELFEELGKIPATERRHTEKNPRHSFQATIELKTLGERKMNSDPAPLDNWLSVGNPKSKLTLSNHL
jgi:hypothetical protein